MTDEPGPADEQPSQPLPQHPHVGRLKPDPAQPALRVTELTGLPGDSDRPGYQRLYLTAKLDYYAEFAVADIISAQDIPDDQSPFPGLAATQVSINRDATISYTWVKSPQPVDEFDLDVRLGAAAGAPVPALAPQTAPINTCPTCRTCQTDCGQATCKTCNTNCGQNTCTCAGQNTCNTCWWQNTCPGYYTCNGLNTCVPITTCYVVGPD